MSIEKSNSCFESFKGVHKNQTLFIIGNGPSLSETNLDLIKDSPSIAMNRISLIYSKFPKWRPTYYIFCSTNIFNPIWGKEWSNSVIEALSDERTISFIDKKSFDFLSLPKLLNKNIRVINKLTENKPNLYGEINPKSFSIDILKSIDKSGSTINLALQIAFYMQPKDIVFLGTDLGWAANNGKKVDNNHFDKSYRAHIPDPIKVNLQMRNIHKLSLKNFKRHLPLVKFYNASKKTKLDIYPIIDFEEYVLNGKVVEKREMLLNAKNYWKGLKKGNRLLVKLRRYIFRLKEKLAFFKKKYLNFLLILKNFLFE